MSNLQPLIEYIRESSATDLEQATIMAIVIDQHDAHQRACDILKDLDDGLESRSLAYIFGWFEKVNQDVVECIKYLEPHYEA